MEFEIMSRWMADLRRDVAAWDRRVREASDSWRMDGPWGWPDMTLPLKYAGFEGDSVRVQ